MRAQQPRARFLLTFLLSLFLVACFGGHGGGGGGGNGGGGGGNGGGGGGNGGGGGVAGGAVVITMPPASVPFPEVVVSGVAGARSTLNLQALVTSGDNGANVYWYVTAPGQANPITGGSPTLGTISPVNTPAGTVVTYTAPTSLPVPPPNNYVTITALQAGTKSAANGPVSTPITVFIVPSNNALPTGGFSGGANFVFRLRGFTASGLTYGIIGRFNMDGVGSAGATTGITNGDEDVNIAQADGSSVAYTKVAFTGGYNMDTSSHGMMKLAVASPAPWSGPNPPPPGNPPPTTMTFSFTLSVDAFTGTIIEADAGGTYAGSGDFQFQAPKIFNSTSISGSYVFSLAGPAGAGTNAVHKGVIGRLDLTTGNSALTGNITSTSTADDESNDPTQSLAGTYTLDGATNDHGTFSITETPSGSTPAVTFYVIASGSLYALETDPNQKAGGKGILLGAASKIPTGANFDNTSLDGSFVFEALGITPSTAANGQGHSSAIVGKFSGSPGAVGAGTLTGIFDLNDGGTVPGTLPLVINGANGQSPGSFTIGTNGRGRGVMNISTNAFGVPVTLHFVFYIKSPNGGALLEQPASDGSNRGRSGHWVAQTVAPPITASGVNATFVAGTGADTAASLNSVTVFAINGSTSPGTFIGTGDASQAGFPPQVPVPGTTSGTFSVTDQNNGRGTITAMAGSVAGSAGAVFYVDDPAEVIVMGTDVSLKEPQIITLDQ